MKAVVAGAACAAALIVTMLAVPAEAQFRLGLGADGPVSSIGVVVAELSEQTAASAKVDRGAVIQRVEGEGPAARAGLLAEDVVVEFDGEAVRSARQFARLVQETRPNRAVPVVVLRKGERQTLTVTPELGRPGALSRVLPPGGGSAGPLLRNAPFSFELDSNGGGWFAPAGGPLGAAVMAIDDQLATYFGVTDGVLVTSVEASSPAAAAGLRAGDVIVSVAGRDVAEPSEVRDAVRAARGGGMLEIRVVREKKEVTLNATLPQPRQPVRVRSRVTI